MAPKFVLRQTTPLWTVCVFLAAVCPVALYRIVGGCTENARIAHMRVEAELAVLKQRDKAASSVDKQPRVVSLWKTVVIDAQNLTVF
jgi:hypothetical protein